MTVGTTEAANEGGEQMTAADISVVSALTDQQVQEWRELEAAATVEPWGVEVTPHRVDIDGPMGGWLFRYGEPPWLDLDPDDWKQAQADARFAAAARTAVPALIADRDRLVAENERLTAVNREMRTLLQRVPDYMRHFSSCGVMLAGSDCGSYREPYCYRDGLVRQIKALSAVGEGDQP